MINYHTPAFPALAHWDRHGQKSAALQFPGMTLLDHFAGLAMQAMVNRGMYLKVRDELVDAQQRLDTCEALARSVMNNQVGRA